VTDFRQSWNRLSIRGRPCRLQVLDPLTTFEVEPSLIENLGETLLMAMAAPETVLAAIGGTAASAHGLSGTLTGAMQDPECGSAVAETGLRLLTDSITSAVLGANLDPKWLAETFERLIFDRFKIDGELIEDWTGWTRAQMRPVDRWRLLAAQISQTYQPLWTRHPYNVRTEKVKTYGVPAPKTPKAVQWAAALAVQKYGSVDEILTCWDPTRLMDVVESAAEKAETERRAHEAAKQDRKGKR
jgi:hypothetical protein